MIKDMAVKLIERKFEVNSIYAQKVFEMIKTSDILVEAEKIIDTRPKPFVKWVGGKRQLLRQFREMNLYPPINFNPKTNKYFEPFVGGGAVFFDLLPEKACLSDLNFELVVTYNVIKNHVDELIRLLKAHVYRKDYFLKIRSQNPKEMSDLLVASRFIYLNRTGFNGLYRVNSRGEFNVPFGSYNNPIICDEDNLRKVSLALKGVEIFHSDYKFILKKARKGDFVYFDPPYYPVSKTASFTSYTNVSFLDDEQIALRDVFFELHKRGCFVMLSNSDAPFINKIYSNLKGININKVRAGRSINSKE